MVSPPDAVQGDLVRIMYVHVPAAWLAYLAFAVTLIGSIGYLVSKDLRWDRVAASSAEIGVYFTGLAIALGMIWAKPTWGVWWTWDARLTLTAIMFFVYLGYLALRRATDDRRLRAGRAAVLGILGAVQIPLVHFSVVWWRTLHQPASILRPDGPAIQDPMMRVALGVAVVAFTVIYSALMTKRIEQHRLTDRIEALDRSESRPVAGASVTAPDLDGGFADE
jgi:heme exporter protein C